MPEIWNHHPGYEKARQAVQAQSYEQDLRTIDDLYGREKLEFGASPADVKAEALRQLEVEWRSERNGMAELMIMAHGQKRGY